LRINRRIRVTSRFLPESPQLLLERQRLHAGKFACPV
jgi:hypothetical protein